MEAVTIRFHVILILEYYIYSFVKPLINQKKEM